ncbi:MAG: hypothetical protein A2039_06105 [Candidatus Melainabacteria bacterium GWA2_34_9]|nr:MAG: hypothetical protein A2039_06105 [Candidatus Melainabacteria bacterium GWA2_34_9]
MSIFEALMLVCFGASWPFAVVKTYRTKNVKGKSSLFLSLVILGYLFGIVHKILYNFDYVIFLYVFNCLMVLLDLILYFKYKKLEDGLNLQDNKQIN